MPALLGSALFLTSILAHLPSCNEMNEWVDYLVTHMPQSVIFWSIASVFHPSGVVDPVKAISSSHMSAATFNALVELSQTSFPLTICGPPPPQLEMVVTIYPITILLGTPAFNTDVTFYTNSLVRPLAENLFHLGDLLEVTHMVFVAVFNGISSPAGLSLVTSLIISFELFFVIVPLIVSATRAYHLFKGLRCHRCATRETRAFSYKVETTRGQSEDYTEYDGIANLFADPSPAVFVTYDQEIRRHNLVIELPSSYTLSDFYAVDILSQSNLIFVSLHIPLKPRSVEEACSQTEENNCEVLPSIVIPVIDFRGDTQLVSVGDSPSERSTDEKGIQANENLDRVFGDLSQVAQISRLLGQDQHIVGRNIGLCDAEQVAAILLNSVHFSQAFALIGDDDEQLPREGCQWVLFEDEDVAELPSVSLPCPASSSNTPVTCFTVESLESASIDDSEDLAATADVDVQDETVKNISLMASIQASDTPAEISAPDISVPTRKAPEFLEKDRSLMGSIHASRYGALHYDPAISRIPPKKPAPNTTAARSKKSSPSLPIDVNTNRQAVSHNSSVSLDTSTPPQTAVDTSESSSTVASVPSFKNPKDCSLMGSIHAPHNPQAGSSSLVLSGNTADCYLMSSNHEPSNSQIGVKVAGVSVSSFVASVARCDFTGDPITSENAGRKDNYVLASVSAPSSERCASNAAASTFSDKPGDLACEINTSENPSKEDDSIMASAFAPSIYSSIGTKISCPGVPSSITVDQTTLIPPDKKGDTFMASMQSPLSSRSTSKSMASVCDTSEKPCDFADVAAISGSSSKKDNFLMASIYTPSDTQNDTENAETIVPKQSSVTVDLELLASLIKKDNSLKVSIQTQRIARGQCDLGSVATVATSITAVDAYPRQLYGSVSANDAVCTPLAEPLIKKVKSSMASAYGPSRCNIGSSSGSSSDNSGSSDTTLFDTPVIPEYVMLFPQGVFASIHNPGNSPKRISSSSPSIRAPEPEMASPSPRPRKRNILSTALDDIQKQLPPKPAAPSRRLPGHSKPLPSLLARISDVQLPNSDSESESEWETEKVAPSGNVRSDGRWTRVGPDGDANKDMHEGTLRHFGTEKNKRHFTTRMPVA